VRDLVQRWGHSGFGLATALVWALPMAFWAGGADLSGTGEAPWIALRIGLVALAAWLLLVGWASRVSVPTRPRRLDVRQMGRDERLAWLGFAGAFTVAVGWLNGAATVDWSLLGGPLARGSAGAWALLTGLALVLAAALVAGTLAWRRARAGWLSRRA
jgi:hypothetical protein